MMSSRPSMAYACSMAALGAVWSVASPMQASIRAPGTCDRNSSRASISSFSRRPMIRTVAPSWASIRALDFPIPWLLPVTSAVFPASTFPDAVCIATLSVGGRVAAAPLCDLQFIEDGKVHGILLPVAKRGDRYATQRTRTAAHLLASVLDSQVIPDNQVAGFPDVIVNPLRRIEIREQLFQQLVALCLGHSDHAGRHVQIGKNVRPSRPCLAAD